MPTQDSRSYFGPFMQDLAPHLCKQKATHTTQLTLLFWAVYALFAVGPQLQREEEIIR
jgi:hypothetical protein